MPSEHQTETITPRDLERLVAETIGALVAKGIPLDDMAPLLKLHDMVQQLGRANAPVRRERRLARQPVSDEVYARACAIIDLLIQGGQRPELAAQTVARQMLAAGVALPETGGDARGWKRLQDWHARLARNPAPSRAEARHEYERFKAELAKIPAEQRLQRALCERLWDRRDPAANAEETA